MDRETEKLFHFPGPVMAGLIDHLLKIPFQMLKTFHVGEHKSLMVIDSIVIMHDGGCGRKAGKDIVFKDSGKIFFHMSIVESDMLISVETETGARGIDKNDGIIPVNQIGEDAGGADIFDKGCELAGEAFLKFAQISLTDTESLGSQTGQKALSPVNADRTEV